MAPDADITFERIAVTLEQIEGFRLPTRPTKASDSRSKGFGDISVKLDAIEPDHLRAIVENTILRHLAPELFDTLRIAEQDERKFIHGLVGLLDEARL